MKLPNSYGSVVKLKGTRRKPSTMHKNFTEEEIELLWQNLNKIEHIDTILIMIYTSMRPTELIKQ